MQRPTMETKHMEESRLRGEESILFSIQSHPYDEDQYKSEDYAKKIAIMECLVFANGRKGEWSFLFPDHKRIDGCVTYIGYTINEKEGHIPTSKFFSETILKMGLMGISPPTTREELLSYLSGDKITNSTEECVSIPKKYAAKAIQFLERN